MASPIDPRNYEEHKQTHTDENSWWVYNHRGIPLTRVCGRCVEVAKERHQIKVFGPKEAVHE